MAIGFLLSLLISNIFTEDFKINMAHECSKKPTIWWRYVDDIFAIWQYNRDELNIFSDHINNRETSIRFTLEIDI